MIRKVVSSSLRSGRNCRWGEWMSSALSTLNTTTEVRPWARHRTPNCSPGATALAAHCSGCVFTVCVRVCVFTAVCVCTLDRLNAEHKFWVWVPTLGRMSRHLKKKYIYLINCMLLSNVPEFICTIIWLLCTVRFISVSCPTVLLQGNFNDKLLKKFQKSSALL